MDEHETSLLDIELDAWVSIGQRLPVGALACLAATCQTLNHHITKNQSLWSARFRQDYRSRWNALSGVHDWPKAYIAARCAAQKFGTSNPYTATVPCFPDTSWCATSQVIITRPKPSELHWQAPTLAASVGERLLWWRPDPICRNSDISQQSPCAASQGLGLQDGGSSGLETYEDADNELAPDIVGQRFFSDPRHGHNAFVDALVKVPASSGMGYASGSRDQTIKLWTPFHSSSRTSSGTVRPIRTLRGHTGSITALLVVPAATAGSSTHSSSSSAWWGSDQQQPGVGWDVPAVLASSSADKTVKIWSLASLQSSSSGSEVDGAAANDGAAQVSRKVSRGGKLSCKESATLQGRNPLLATLRGHSDCVTDLQLHLDSSSSSSSGAFCKLISSSRDSRIKMWDLNSQSCVTTWKLPGPCRKLLHGLVDLGNNSVITVLGSRSLTVLDPRVPGSTVTSQKSGVLTVQWPSGGTLKSGAAYGTTLAAGGRKGFRVWDLRSPPPTAATLDLPVTLSASSDLSCKSRPARLQESKVAAADNARLPAAGSSSSSSKNSSSRVLFAGQLPSNLPVDALYMDRQKLVAATHRAKLHSGASVGVWSLQDGRRVQLLSSTNQPVRVYGFDLDDFGGNNDNLDDQHAGQSPAAAAAATTADAAVPAEVYDSIATLDPCEIREAFHLWQYARQQQQQPQGHGGNIPWQQQQHAALHDDDDVESIQDSDGDLEAGSSSSNDNDSWQQHGSRQETSEQSADWGRIEPGILCMAVSGPVFATVNTSGHILLRDFSRGSPPVQCLQQYCSSSSSSSSGNQPSSSSSAAAAAVAEQQEPEDGGEIPQMCSKFWRGSIANISS